ncbi:MAG: class A beta-lactamase, subclass A2 [Acidobacteriota bacterium]|nr:class A beta-lactamase, subclass A2 [Acidobacteriota bacterium]
MKKILSVYVLIFVCLTSACPAQKDSSLTVKTVNAANSQPAKTVEKIDVELQKQIEQIAFAAKGRVGVKAVLLETGETVLLNQGEHFPMQSVYKLPIAMAVLRQVDAGKITPDQKVRIEKSDFVRIGMRSPIRDENPNGSELSVKELLQFAVSESDGTASDVLLRLVGGSKAAMNYLSEIKVGEIIIANTEKEFGQDQTLQYKNWASPAGAIDLLRALHERRGGFSEQSRALLLKFMTESPTGPKRLKGLLPKDAAVAHKTGTSGTINGVTAATNDIGIITLPNGKHFVIAVFVSDSTADEKTREEVIAKVTKAIWDKWSN